jgi:tetratricopeptide (TPR) repeat protein
MAIERRAMSSFPPRKGISGLVARFPPGGEVDVLAILTALSYLLQSFAIASALLLVAGGLRLVRERFPACKRLKAWRRSMGLAAIIAWLLGSGAGGVRGWLEEQASLELWQGPTGELVQKATLLGLQRDLRGTTAGSIGLAREAFQSGERAMAARRYREGVEDYARSVRTAPTAAGYLNLGVAWLCLEEFRAAEEAFRAGLEIAQRAGNTREAGACLDGMGRTALGQERLEEAMAFYAEALEVHTQIGNMLGRAMTHAGIANVYRQQGRLDDAFSSHQDAFALYTRLGNRLGRANALDCLSDIYRRLGRLDAALRASREALGLDEEFDNPLGQARDLETIAAVHLAEGERQAALDVLQKALATYRRAGVVSKRTQATERLIGQLRAAKGGG